MSEMITDARQEQVLSLLGETLLDLSGFELDELDMSASFLELGFDSLFLIQFSQEIKNNFKVNISFRELIEGVPNFPALVEHIANEAPVDVLPTAAASAVESAPVAQMSAPDVTALPPQQPALVQPASIQPAAIPPVPSMPSSPAMPPVAPVQPMQMNVAPLNPVATAGLEAIMAQQLQLMSMQIAMLSGGASAEQMPMTAPTAAVPQTQVAAAVSPSAPVAVPTTDSVAPTSAPLTSGSVTQANKVDDAQEGDDFAPKSSKEMKPFGAIARINLGKGDELTAAQHEWMDNFIARYNAMTAKSKAYMTEHHAHHADPRVVSGFKLKTKELIYPIVAERTEGCRIWDIDGNEFVDALNGFGSNFFGYAHPRITQAIVDQLWKGVEIGPQSPVVGEVAKMVCEFTGMDRAGFCNTGSEAVMGAMRIARTVTGRKTIVIFTGAYHGIFDEVIVRPTRRKNMPAAPGIMPSAVENVLVLEYGTDESLEIIRERADELAAVMIEPIQSRRPEFQPREFLHEIRKITEESGTAFIFDEVITGFRMGPGGAQEFFGIQADIGTYGKVVGGGLSIGVVAGKAKWMDALDGGPWQYGDESQPEVGVTYFAGTFVRHPAAVAACKAALEILRDEGPALQLRVNAQTSYLVSELNNFFRDREVPLEVNHFSSLWRMTYTESVPYSEVLFYLIREKGVHIYDGFPCFLTMAHTDADVDIILHAIKESVTDLQAAGFLPQPTAEVAQADFFVTAS